MTDFQQTALMTFLGKRDAFLYNKLLELRGAVERWLTYIPNTFPHYTSHTVHHSDQIVLQISNLLFRDDSADCVVQLSCMEAYVMVAAAFLHDVGMVVSDRDKAEILGSEAWGEWVGSGRGAQRFRDIGTFRIGENPPDESVRNFLADIQTRYLLAEFIRLTHHSRAVDLMVRHHHELGGFGLDDPLLLQTISDVCAAHGLAKHELESRGRFPELRDIRGERANVRFLAILLRMGDLLDMSQDRACPFLLNAACPLPPESLAHWTKYQRFTHFLVCPERIELTAECQNQEEHRFLLDWCKWLEDEVKNASILMLRAERHGNWQPPRLSVHSETGSIKIRPAKGAKYIFSNWVFELDQEAVFQRLVKDLYDHPAAYVRELIQNALDATRCQMYIDLNRDGLEIPDCPTKVDEKHRLKYPIRIRLRNIEITNELSGGKENRQILSVEDCGVGMDKHVIHSFLLQVGRSYYTSEEFRRTYSFIPTSRFGLGFLSVFAVSNRITVDTFKPSSAPTDGPIRLTLTGPRNYLLMETGERRPNGTKVEMILNEALKPGELTRLVQYWCTHVEFPILLDDLGAENEVLAERPEQFTYEIPDASEEGAKLAVRAFDVDRPGIGGNLYVFARITVAGESWASWSWAENTYPKLHPRAEIPSFPDSIVCLNGIRVGSGHSYRRGPMAARLDFRNAQHPVNISRSRVHGYANKAQRSMEPELVSRWEEILLQHLASSNRAKSEGAWRYKQRLVDCFPLTFFWENLPETIRVHIGGRSSLLSCADVMRLQTVTTVVHPRSPFHSYLRDLPDSSPFTPVWGADDFGFAEEDLIQISSAHREAIFGPRHIAAARWLSSGHLAIDWVQGEQTSKLIDNPTAGFAPLENEQVIGFFLHHTTGSSKHILFNSNNEFIKWLVRVNEACAKKMFGLSPKQAERLNHSFCWVAMFNISDEFALLSSYIKRWREMQGLPADLYPPETSISQAMFELRSAQ